jgi:hypothetical protein
MAMMRKAMCRAAMSCPMVPRGSVAAAMATARIFLRGGCNLGIRVRGRHPLVLIVRIGSFPRNTMGACHWPKHGQTLVIGIRRLDFFALINAAWSGVRTRGSRDQSGGENTEQSQSQGFIL